MNKVSNEILTAAMNWRYAVKKFDSTKKISGPDWETLEESLRLSPSSFGLQPWKFLVVQNMDVRKKLTPHSWHQPQIESCSHLVIVANRKTVDAAYVDRFVQQTAELRGVPAADMKGYRDMMIANVVDGIGKDSVGMSAWTARQAYISAGVYMTNAALLGIDVCPMEGFDPVQYNEILGLANTEYSAAIVLASGYRATDDTFQNAKKSRFIRADVIETMD